jgi:hypothetical protein
MVGMKNFLYQFYKPFLSKEDFKFTKSIEVSAILISPSHNVPPAHVEGKLSELLFSAFSSISSIPYTKTRLNEDVYFYHYDLDTPSIELYKSNFVANCLSRLYHPEKQIIKPYYGNVLVVSSFIFQNSKTLSNKDVSSHINFIPSEIFHQIYRIYEYTKTF